MNRIHYLTARGYLCGTTDYCDASSLIDHVTCQSCLQSYKEGNRMAQPKIIHLMHDCEALCGARDIVRYLSETLSDVTCEGCLRVYDAQLHTGGFPEPRVKTKGIPGDPGPETVRLPGGFTIADRTDLLVPFGSLNPWTFLKAAQFFPAYAPGVKNYKHKIRGKNSNDNPIGFTEADKAAIRAGIAKLSQQLRNAAICLLLLLTACQKDIPSRPTPEEVEAAPPRPRVDTATAGPDFVDPGK